MGNASFTFLKVKTFLFNKGSQDIFMACVTPTEN